MLALDIKPELAAPLVERNLEDWRIAAMRMIEDGSPIKTKTVSIPSAM